MLDNRKKRFRNRNIMTIKLSLIKFIMNVPKTAIETASREKLKV